MTEILSRSSKVARWGNSAAVRISIDALEAVRLHVDDAVDVIVRDDEIVIRRRAPRVTMADLIADFDQDKHRHDLAFDVGPAGSETG